MRKIVIVFIIVILTFFSIVYLYKNNYFSKKHDDFSITKQLIIKDIADKKNVIVVINGEQIGFSDFEIQKKAIEAYDEEEKEELNKNNEIIETIKHKVILQEAKKEDINPDFDIETMKSVANSMYENSDKTLSKDEYIEKWVEIQKENEIKSIYMAEIMEKIVNDEIETDSAEVIMLIENYKNDKNVKNLRKVYEAYIESIAGEYDLEISKDGEKIYKNYN